MLTDGHNTLAKKCLDESRSIFIYLTIPSQLLVLQAADGKAVDFIPCPTANSSTVIMQSILPWIGRWNCGCPEFSIIADFTERTDLASSSGHCGKTGADEIYDGVDNDCNGEIDDVSFDTPYSLSCYPLNVMPNPFTKLIEIQYSQCYTWKIMDNKGKNIDSSNGSVCGNFTIDNADSYSGKIFILIITNVATNESISIQLIKSGGGGGGKGRGR
jgi:hypothetical protein